MPFFVNLSFSLVVYALLFYFIIKQRVDLKWPTSFFTKSLWIVWIVFLSLFIHVWYENYDVRHWLNSFYSILDNQPMSEGYVYLPIFSIILSSLAFPFQFFNVDLEFILILIMHLVMVWGYVVSVELLYNLTKNKELPILIAFGPSVLFFLLLGKNHILMLALTLLVLYFTKKRNAFLVGVMLSILCYKVLTIPFVGLALILLLFFSNKKINPIQLLTGFILAFIPNIVYFIFRVDYFELIFMNQGNIGLYKALFEERHIFFVPNYLFPKISEYYFNYKLWFLLSTSGFFISLYNYVKKKVNFVQALLICYGTICVFAPEAMRVELLVGLGLIDANNRKDKILLVLCIFPLFLTFLSWVPYIEFKHHFIKNLVYDRKLFFLLNFFNGVICLLISFKSLVTKNRDEANVVNFQKE